MRDVALRVAAGARYDLGFTMPSGPVALRLDDGVIGEARVALGGVGTVPWRAPAAEEVLRGAPASAEVFAAAGEAAIRDPFVVEGTAFKVELAKRTVARALHTAAGGTS